ncbi:MAG: hypothetical protein KY469_17680 [Actinobacteria bacterium]|nr:hypothetical protein [Actinomycetota bacterium]
MTIESVTTPDTRDRDVHVALALRQQLRDNAWLFEDAAAYRAGVDDALEAVAGLPFAAAIRDALTHPPGDRGVADA